MAPVETGGGLPRGDKADVAISLVGGTVEHHEGETLRYDDFDEQWLDTRFVLSGNEWPQPGGNGTPVTITYSYSNGTDGLLNGVRKKMKAGNNNT